MNSNGFILLMLILVGCGGLPQKFDGGEYQYYVSMAKQIHEIKGTCGTPAVAEKLPKLQSTVDKLEIYTKQVSNNTSIGFAEDVSKLVTGLKPNGSKVYCEEYTSNIQVALNGIMKTLRERTR